MANDTFSFSSPDDQETAVLQQMCIRDRYDSYASKSKLSYYPDYAASSLTDAIPASFQELVNGTKDTSAVLKDIHSKYDSGVEEMGFSN